MLKLMQYSRLCWDLEGLPAEVLEGTEIEGLPFLESFVFPRDPQGVLESTDPGLISSGSGRQIRAVYLPSKGVFRF